MQIRWPQWQASADRAVYLKASYGIALHFALPAVMSVLALVDENDTAYWRTSFAIVALGGAVALIVMHPLVSRMEKIGSALSFPVGGALGLVAYLAAIAGYVTVGGLAIRGGAQELRAEEILLTALVFVGFTGAWLLMSEDVTPPSAVQAEPAEQADPARPATPAEPARPATPAEPAEGLTAR